MASFTSFGDLFPTDKYSREHRYVLPYQFYHFPFEKNNNFDFNQTRWTNEHLIIFFDYDELTTDDQFKNIILNSPNKGMLHRPFDDLNNVKREMTSFKIIGKVENKTFCLMKTEIFRKDKDQWISDKEEYESRRSR